MSSLIAMCAYCTEENGKLKYLEETLKSLIRTVDFTKHRLAITNNSQFKDAIEYLNDFQYVMDGCDLEVGVFHSPTNLGTAEGINLAIKERLPNEVVVKCDDDWTTDIVGWVDILEQTLSEHPEIGILGLKRDDVYGDFDKHGYLWYSEDIFGTCTAYNPKMLDKCGFLNQPSASYGFDDNLISCRSICAGFKNAFRVDIPIVNLDTGGTEYTEWKKREAGVYLQEVGIMCDMYRNGQLDVYYNPYA